MFNLNKFIGEHVTHRAESMFAADISANSATLSAEIKDKKVCVIGGAGSIGSSFIKAVLRFEPKSMVVVDLNENGLAELVRDVRSTDGLFVPDEFRCYTLNFADPIFERIFHEEKGFDIVANFSAHKHVRSEKDRYSVQALIENNDIKAKRLMDLLCVYPPRHFFCVSTDKAANPVNIMGASKRIMEDLVMAYNERFKVTTARFANVAFSNGSLPDGWLHRLQKKQPLAAFRCETLLCVARRIRTNLYACMHSRQWWRGVFSETRRRPDADVLRDMRQFCEGGRILEGGMRKRPGSQTVCRPYGL